jgi:hypothetical protein
MQQFQGKELVNVRGVVAISFEVPQDSSFDAFAVEVGTRKRPRVEQHVPNIPGQCVSVPNAEVIELVPAKKKPFRV